MPVEATKSPADEGTEDLTLEANNSKKLPIETQTILNKSPIMVTNSDLPIVVEAAEAQFNANDYPLGLVEINIKNFTREESIVINMQTRVHILLYVQL